MVKGYCTTTTVSEFLQTDITAGSTPSISTVNEWIEWAEDRIEEVIGFEYTTSAKTNVIFSGNGSLNFWFPREYLPLVSISKFEINTGTDFDITWTEITQGTQYLIEDLDTGRILFNSGISGNVPKSQAFRISFIYGYETIPYIIEELATKLTAKKFIQSKLGKDGSSGNESIKVGPITISDGSSQTLSYVKGLNQDIDMLLKQLSTFKTYIY